MFPEGLTVEVVLQVSESSRRVYQEYLKEQEKEDSKNKLSEKADKIKNIICEMSKNERDRFLQIFSLVLDEDLYTQKKIIDKPKILPLSGIIDDDKFYIYMGHEIVNGKDCRLHNLTSNYRIATEAEIIKAFKTVRSK